MKDLTIVICTYNRALLIGKLINYFDTELLIPKDFSWEILFVDNGSSDNTKETILSAQRKDRTYELRYVQECVNGLANARNRGSIEADGKNILFLDDDSLPDKAILTALWHAFRKHPSISCFAIKVINHHLNTPSWYRFEGRYRMLDRGNYDLGNNSRFLTTGDPLPIGSGMVIAKHIFSDIGMFNPVFGYDLRKEMYVPGEETELFLRITSIGHRIFYIHDAVVNHYPEQEKFHLVTLCKTYLGIGFWYGSADAKNSHKLNIITWAGYPRTYYKRFLLVIFPYLLTRICPNRSVRYYYLFQMKKTLGLFKGFRTFRHP